MKKNRTKKSLMYIIRCHSFYFCFSPLFIFITFPLWLFFFASLLFRIILHWLCIKWELEIIRRSPTNWQLFCDGQPFGWLSIADFLSVLQFFSISQQNHFSGPIWSIFFGYCLASAPTFESGHFILFCLNFICFSG